MTAAKQGLLLHACCGPCAVLPLPYFLASWDVLGLFFNPNIQPSEEHDRRLEGARAVFARHGARLEETRNGPGQEAWERLSEPRYRQARCEMCYRVRLEAAAGIAAERGVGAFSTTLLVSPYQDRGRIVAVGEAVAAERGLRFVGEDLRPMFRKGQAEARSMGIYMQKYCGCLPSALEAEASREAKGWKLQAIGGN